MTPVDFYLFIWWCQVFVAWTFSSCREQALLQLWCAGFSLRWLLLLHGLKGVRASQLQLPSSRGLAQQLLCMDLVALQHIRSSQICVFCIVSWILYHWVTREALLRHLIDISIYFIYIYIYTYIYMYILLNHFAEWLYQVYIYQQFICVSFLFDHYVKKSFAIFVRKNGNFLLI